MTASVQESPQELDLEARKAAGIELQVGDRVRHAISHEYGIVARIEGGRYFVSWLRGHVFIYPSADLILLVR